MKQYNRPPSTVIDTAKSYTATIKTNRGESAVKLEAAKAPVKSFCCA